MVKSLSDLNVDPFHVVTIVNRPISQTATSPCYVFIELPNPTALV